MLRMTPTTRWSGSVRSCGLIPVVTIPEPDYRHRQIRLKRGLVVVQDFGRAIRTLPLTELDPPSPTGKGAGLSVE
jgi:hypothetical protein